MTSDAWVRERSKNRILCARAYYKMTIICDDTRVGENRLDGAPRHTLFGADISTIGKSRRLRLDGIIFFIDK